MADWYVESGPSNRLYPYNYVSNQPYPDQPVINYLTPQAQSFMPPPSPPRLALRHPPSAEPSTSQGIQYQQSLVRRETPREIRNKAEKQRRDKLNQSISDLASMVPPIVASSRKIDKTGILRLTAHYLRSHQYVFGDTLDKKIKDFKPGSTKAILSLMKGFLITVTYKGIIVVISQNVHEYLGYSELDLLGQSVFNIVNEEDHRLLKEQLMPMSHLIGPNGQLLIPDEPDGKQNIADLLTKEKRRFIIRFKKFTLRSEPVQYLTCHVEGSFRKSDRACRSNNRCCQMVRRVRARCDKPCSSGNDVVFIGFVRPASETFLTEKGLEAFCMEYRTRHSIDGQIIQCEQRIALVTGYMTHEVNGVNAMNFMHRDDVHWVINALREMYDHQHLFGESCYRLMTKNGQFIYMKTRGRLDVDHESRAVTSFICTNTVIDEQEGKHLIKLMKQKLIKRLNNNGNVQDLFKSVSDSSIQVEDPRHLEKVILHLVTNLPAPKPGANYIHIAPNRGEYRPMLPFIIIPPKRERIIGAIEKVYGVIRTFQQDPTNNNDVNEIDLTEASPVPAQAISSPSIQSTYIEEPMPPLVDQIFVNETTVQYYSNEENTLSNDYIENMTIENALDETPLRIPSCSIDSTSGKKRHLHSSDHDDRATKRLTTENQSNDPEDENNAITSDIPFFENFLNNELLVPEFSLDSALCSLDQIDPTFPDLLTSKNVQEILGEFENDNANADTGT